MLPQISRKNKDPILAQGRDSSILSGLWLQPGLISQTSRSFLRNAQPVSSQPTKRLILLVYIFPLKGERCPLDSLTKPKAFIINLNCAFSAN